MTTENRDGANVSNEPSLGSVDSPRLPEQPFVFVVLLVYCIVVTCNLCNFSPSRIAANPLHQFIPFVAFYILPFPRNIQNIFYTGVQAFAGVCAYFLIVNFMGLVAENIGGLFIILEQLFHFDWTHLIIAILSIMVFAIAQRMLWKQ